jgi:hypothetical protein
MARKVIIEEPNTVSSLRLFGIAAIILALGGAFYFERQVQGKILRSNSTESEKLIVLRRRPAGTVEEMCHPAFARKLAVCRGTWAEIMVPAPG